MRKLGILALFLATTAFTQSKAGEPPLGTYSAFTEADWSVAFDLQEKGKAVIILDSQSKSKVRGAWKYKAPYLTLSYKNFHDIFLLQDDCNQGHPCFLYDPKRSRTKVKSPLNVEYEFVNWDASAAPQSYQGYYVYGHEVETFQPCGSKQSLWLIGDADLLKRLRDSHAEMTKKKPYAQIYVRLMGSKTEKAKDGFAANYPGQFLALQILEIWPKGDRDCMN